MTKRSLSRIWFAICFGQLFLGQNICRGEVYDFDLTTVVNSDLTTPLEAVVDLGTQFSSIESASVVFQGEFSPALVTLVTVPEFSGPVVNSDNVNVIIRLGEVGTAWINKDVYAIQEMQDMDGPYSFDLPMLGVQPTIDPTFLPNGQLPPDFYFLLDGKFGLSVGWSHWLTLNLYELQPPRFENATFTLRVNGITVPEPSSASIILLAAIGLIPLVSRLARRTLIHRRTDC